MIDSKKQGAAPMTRFRFAGMATGAAAMLAGLVPLAHAQTPSSLVPKDGYLCCNLRANGSWASDANAPRAGDRLLRAGTRVIGLGYGSTQVDVQIEGKKYSIGNDYSRSVPMEEFAMRWIVGKDPTADMKKWTPRIRQSIEAQRVMPGMNRRQVMMSLGWPTADSTSNLRDPIWHYTASTGSRYKVIFNEAWLVKAVDADANTKAAVLLPTETKKPKR
jgi:hypothetical protein